jgi:hypothetical protein
MFLQISYTIPASLQKSQKILFVRIRKDSYTNPASLKITNCISNFLLLIYLFDRVGQLVFFAMVGKLVIWWFLFVVGTF